MQNLLVHTPPASLHSALMWDALMLLRSDEGPVAPESSAAAASPPARGNTSASTSHWPNPVQMLESNAPKGVEDERQSSEPSPSITRMPASTIYMQFTDQQLKL